MSSSAKPSSAKPSSTSRPAAKTGLSGKQARRAAAARRQRMRRSLLIGAAALVVLAVLYLIYSNATGGRPSAPGAKAGSGYEFAVGRPGPGAAAPGFMLDATTGSRLDLASLKGKTVLLYFQEGLSCQPCWEQIKDLEKHSADLKGAGIDQVVSITTDPIDLIKQKTTDMGLSTTVLSDPDLAVSKTYSANSYGMMGISRDGHSFILVNADGSIGWRADYGGAPKYTMFLPTSAILADLSAYRATATATGTATP